MNTVIDEQLRGVYDDQAGKLMYLKTDTDGKESLTDSETPKPVIACKFLFKSSTSFHPGMATRPIPE